MFPRIGRGGGCFFQALDSFAENFPGLGKSRVDFSGAWKAAGGALFSGLHRSLTPQSSFA
jgi:hypothetical protein